MKRHGLIVSDFKCCQVVNKHSAWRQVVKAYKFKSVRKIQRKMFLILTESEVFC